MKIPSLATVYLDNEPVGLMGDPRPRVSKIVVAGGKKPEAVQVLRGQSPDDMRGKPVSLDETIDRTAEPTTPIYLKCVAKPFRAPIATNIAPPPVATAKTPPQYVEWSTDSPEPHLPNPIPLGPRDAADED